MPAMLAGLDGDALLLCFVVCRGALRRHRLFAAARDDSHCGEQRGAVREHANVILHGVSLRLAERLDDARRRAQAGAITSMGRSARRTRESRLRSRAKTRERMRRARWRDQIRSVATSTYSPTS